MLNATKVHMSPTFYAELSCVKRTVLSCPFFRQDRLKSAFTNLIHNLSWDLFQNRFPPSQYLHMRPIQEAHCESRLSVRFAQNSCGTYNMIGGGGSKLMKSNFHGFNKTASLRSLNYVSLSPLRTGAEFP